MSPRLLAALFVLFAVLSVVPACSNDARLGLLPSNPRADDAEHERLRRMQMLRILSFRSGGFGGGSHLDTAIPVDIDPTALEQLLSDHVCNEEINLRPPCAGHSDDSCMACGAWVQLCIAQHLLDAARVRATPIHIHP